MSRRCFSAATMPDALSSLQEDLFRRSITLQDGTADSERHHFPKKLAFGLASAKVFCGLLLLVFGLISMAMDAAMASLASGVWAGAVAMATGLSGILLIRCAQHTGHVLVFLCLSVLSVLTSGLATVFTATGVAHDATLPTSYYVDSEGRRVLFASDITSRAPLLAVAALTLTTAVADCALAVACCVVAAREACHCYICSASDPSFTDPDSKVRHDRLVTWLGQQALMEFMLASGKMTGEVPPARPSLHPSSSSAGLPLPRPKLATTNKTAT